MAQEWSGDRSTEVAAGFGVRLRRYRELAGLSQDQLAERAGLSAKAIGALERGERRRPHPQTVDLLVKALGLGAGERAELVVAAMGRGSARPVAASLASSSRPPEADSEPIPVAPVLAEREASRSNLPAPVTAFIGREREIGGLTDLLRRRDVRLVTLTGTGGTGKTRLAIEVANRVGPDFPNGMYFVSLAPVTDPSLVVSTIAQTIGVRESAVRPLIESLQAFLREKTCLLVLDNFEQLVSAAPIVGGLLLACPSLKVLVTSRSLLRAYGEHEHVVEPLDIPHSRHLPPLVLLGQIESVQLFLARAQAARSDFLLTRENASAVAALCARLDGLPLAIELAAARVRMFSPAALLSRLQGRLDLLTSTARDVPARQQTVRITIDWSYYLLDEAEKALFRRLCVFVGAFDLASVEAVCEGSADGLDSLVAKSLVRSRPIRGESWFGLFETIREYGLERLEESGEKVAAERAHAVYFLTRAQESGARRTERDFGPNTERLALVEDNVRTAFTYFVEHGDGESALRLASEMAELFYCFGANRTARAVLEQALTLVEPPSLPLLRADALRFLVELASLLGDYGAAAISGQQAVDLYRTLGNQSGMAITLSHLGFARNLQGDYGGSLRLFDEALTIQRQVEDPLGLYWVLTDRADGAVDREDVETARASLAEVIPIARQLGGELLSYNLWNVARLATLEGDFVRAEAAAREGLALEQLGGRGAGTIHNLYLLAYLAAWRGDLASAQRLTAEAFTVARAGSEEYAPSPFTWYGLDHYAIVARANGLSERAVRLAGAVTALREANRMPRHPIWRTLLRRANVPVERPADPAKAAAWDEGWRMAIEEAIAYALDRRGE